MTNRLTLILLLFSIHVSATEVKSPINLGNYHMINKNYAIAVDHYVAALGRLPSNDKGKQYVFITEQLAIANQKLKNYNKSVFYFDQAIESELRTPNALFQYAKLLVTLKQYDKASKLFTEWGELSDNKVVAQNYTSFISSIHKSDGMESKIVVSKTPWSTDEYNEFCPILHPSGSIVYTSDQPSVKNSKQNTDQSFPMNLYSVRRVDNYEFAPEVSPFFAKKSGYNRGVGCLTNDGKTIYFTGNTESKIPVFSNKPTQFKLGIFVSNYDGYRWSKPREINISNSKYNYAFPTLSEHGDTMVFSSDALGGEGAMDLFYSTNSNGEWSTPVNLGNKINTSGEEIYPRLQYDGNRHTLYFSSDGRPGYGGLDLYQTGLSTNDSSTVTILPQPLNSSYDDFGYMGSKGGAFGYISSNRGGTDDVYSFGSMSGREINTYQPTDVNTVVKEKIETPAEVIKVVKKDTAVKTQAVVKTITPKVEKVIIQPENKTVVQTETKETVSSKPTVKTNQVNTPYEHKPNTEIVEYYSLSGYYMVVYSVKNFSGFAAFRDTNFPDALIVRNKTGFYHLVYFMGDTREEALGTFNNRENRFAKSWLTHFSN